MKPPRVVIAIVAHNYDQADLFCDAMGWDRNYARIISKPDQLRGIGRAVVFLLDNWDRQKSERDVGEFKYIFEHPGIAVAQVNSNKLT